MDFIITFFRDILDGPVYIVVTVICSILICACIGYLAEKSQKKKKEKDQYVQIENAPVGPAPITNVVSTAVSPTPVVSTNPAMPEVASVPVSVPSVNLSASPTPASAQPVASSGVEINMPPVQPIPTTVAPPTVPGVSPTVPETPPTTGVNLAPPTIGTSTSVNPK